MRVISRADYFYNYYFIFFKTVDTDQTVATAYYIWRKKRNKREKRDKASILLKTSQKIVKKSKKKSKWSYQKKQITLKNTDIAQNQLSQ
jgi:hypothetical protein